MRDCVVIHPGVQHSGLAARALYRRGRLRTLLTRLQLGEDPGASWRAAIRSPWARVVLERRLVLDVPDQCITRVAPYDELLRRLPVWRASHELREQTDARFQRRCLWRIPRETKHLLLTDGAAIHILHKTMHTGFQRVLDVAHPSPWTVRDALQEDMSQHGFAATDYDDKFPGPSDDARSQEELRLADKILVASSYTAESVRRAYPGAQICVVPYGVSVSPPQASRPRKPGPLRLLFVGAMSERKGVTLLARSMRRLHADRADVHLDVIGGAVAGARQPDWPDNVTVHGKVSGESVSRAFGTADYLVLPSICEGFGRVIIEALSYGCGVLTTERGVAPDILRRYPDAPVVVCPVADRSRLSDWIASLVPTVQNDSAEARRYHAMKAAELFSEQQYELALDGAMS